MPARLEELEAKGLAKPPTWLARSIQYEVYMGSAAYGCSNDTSDIDCYGWAFPPKDLIFTHLQGHIPGFGQQPHRFEQYTEHGIQDKTALSNHGREYDYSIYSIVKYFQLVMENNPNMLDSLWVPDRCVLHMTPLGAKVRENKKLFLSKKSFHTFKGYAYQQVHKIRTKNPTEKSKRKETVEKYGFDVKFAYHVVRLLNECQQILESGEVDLERDRETYKSIRRGEWTVEQIEDYFNRNLPLLEDLYKTSPLRHKPDEQAIKNLLLECLEQHFGSIDDCVRQVDPALKLIDNIENMIREYKMK